MNKELSFILTTIGRKSVLDTFISLSKQIMIDYEIIIVDNTLGNIQPTIEKLAEQENSDDIKKALASTLFISSPIQNSVGLSRNQGTVYSRSDYVCYVSDDCLFDPFFGSSMLKIVEPNVIPICNTTIIDKDTQSIHENLIENDNIVCLNANKVYSSSFIIHKDIVKEYPFHLGLKNNLGYKLLDRLSIDDYSFKKVDEQLHSHLFSNRTWDTYCNEIYKSRYEKIL